MFKRWREPRVSLCTALLLTLGACAKPESRETVASSHAVSAARESTSSVAAPPGYRPPSLFPADYAPPSLLTLTPEQQLEVYKTMEKTYAGQAVKRGEHESPLPTAAAVLKLDISWGGKKYDDVEAFMQAARFTGVLVLKDGKIELEHYALGRTAADRWTSFSVAKSITSLLIGAALQDGSIRSLDEPVTHYIPELSGSAYEGVSIRQLVTMTSGVKWNENYADPNSDVARSAIGPSDPGIHSPLVSYMRRLPRAAEPGATFLYKTGETDLAGILVANATGRGLAQYLSEKIWVPFGMESDAFWMVDRGSMERGGCCLSMTLRDYGRIALFVLGNGMADGKQVVPTTFLRDATSVQVPASPNGPYGYFWWVHGSDSVSARGIYGQTIWIVPSEQLALITNGAWTSAMAPEGYAAVTALFQAVRSAPR